MDNIKISNNKLFEIFILPCENSTTNYTILSSCIFKYIS